MDVAGDGFHLTDELHGVVFDLRANREPGRWAWTQANSDDAWLALDRNGDGLIGDGTELFGNFTPQPESPNPNGYLALAVFDENGDGKIDWKDPEYSQLRLWQDRNHDGLSQSGELHTLAEAGIVALSTKYDLSARIDENGNAFRYRSDLDRSPSSRVNRTTYDVFLGGEGQLPEIAFGRPRGESVDENGVLHESILCPMPMPMPYPPPGGLYILPDDEPPHQTCVTASGQQVAGPCAGCDSQSCMFTCFGDTRSCYMLNRHTSIEMCYFASFDCQAI